MAEKTKTKQTNPIILKACSGREHDMDGTFKKAKVEAVSTKNIRNLLSTKQNNLSSKSNPNYQHV